MTSATPAPPAPTKALRPVSEAERIALLDVVRGFALYGVLLANTIPWYSGRALLQKEPIVAETSTVDKVALYLVHVLVDGKAMTLLSLLFGLGFAAQLTRAEAQGRSVVPVYCRRLGILFLIGVGHIVFLWWGDILTSYAISGFALILFRRRSDRALLYWAAGLILVPDLVASIPAVSEALQRLLQGRSYNDASRARLLAAVTGNDHVELARAQVRQSLEFVARIAVSFYLWNVGRFLLGYVVGRRRLLHDAADHRPIFRKLLGWGLGLGLPATLTMTILRDYWRSAGAPPRFAELAQVVPDNVGAIGLAVAYMSALALLMQRPAWRRWLMILAPVGQMALSTYLGQSLICTFIFYGWGLGLLGRVGPALCIPLTLAIFAAQILFSRVWLRYFRFGPVEWLWRSLTYGRVQPLFARPHP